MATSALHLKGITKSFGPLVANDNIDLKLDCGEILALLGENGAGKTTLMNILFGHYTADSGTIEVFNTPLPAGSPQSSLASGIGMVHQHFTLADNMTVLDNITLGCEPLFALRRKKDSARQKIKNLSEQFGLHVDPNAQVKSLSIGQQQRVEILKALYRDVKILILDEPTAVLTPQESETLFTTLRLLVTQGLAVIFITHKLKEVVAASDRCTVLRHGKVVHHCATKDTTADALAAAMVGGTIPQTTKETHLPGEELLSLHNIQVQTDDKEGMLEDINLTLHAGEIVGIAGVSGNGQKRLADFLSGTTAHNSGEIFFQKKALHKISPKDFLALGFGRIPEDRNSIGLIGDMTVSENIIAEEYTSKKYSSLGFFKFSHIQQETRRLLKKYDVRGAQADTTTRQLSGGNMQKLILARALDKAPQFIIASQPSWGLDVGATAFVHRQLLEARKQGAAILLISEDLDELFQLADRLHVMYKGKLTSSIDPKTVDAAQLGLAMSGHTISPSTSETQG